jgi:hypothetical protein
MVEGVIDELSRAAFLKIALEIVYHTAGMDVDQVRVEQVAEDIQVTAKHGRGALCFAGSDYQVDLIVMRHQPLLAPP